MSIQYGIENCSKRRWNLKNQGKNDCANIGDGDGRLLIDWSEVKSRWRGNTTLMTYLKSE